RADGDEADVPERHDAGVADEEVERDDDGDVHERRDDVRLRRARDGRAEQSDQHDEQDGREELQRGAGASHTRSVGCWPTRVNSPPGRISRTRITAANRNDGRYWLWFVGSAPPRKPDAK